MKVMLEEIARKKAEAAQAQLERARREQRSTLPQQHADAPPQPVPTPLRTPLRTRTKDDPAR